MTTHFHFAWDFARFPVSAQLRVVESGGAASVLSFSTGVSAHAGPNEFGLDTSYADDSGYMHFPFDKPVTYATPALWASRLLAAMNADATLAGTYSLAAFSNGRYTITSNTSWSFDAPLSNVLGLSLVGCATSSTSFAANWTSQRDVWFYRAAAHGYLSDVTEEYEAGDIATDAETDANFGGGIAWSEPPRYQDFTLALEHVDDVFAYRNRPTYWSQAGAGVLTAAAWTWQHAWQHARNTMPFMVAVDPVYTISSGVYLYLSNGYAPNGTAKFSTHRLTADGARFAPERAVADYDERWNLRFRTRIEERAPLWTTSA